MATLGQTDFECQIPIREGVCLLTTKDASVINLCKNRLVALLVKPIFPNLQIPRLHMNRDYGTVTVKQPNAHRCKFRFENLLVYPLRQHGTVKVLRRRTSIFPIIEEMLIDSSFGYCTNDVEFSNVAGGRYRFSYIAFS